MSKSTLKDSIRLKIKQNAVKIEAAFQMHFDCGLG